MIRRSLAAALIGLAATAGAEVAQYGDVELRGLSRERSWTAGAGQYDSMVCNVGDATGFLAVRTGPGTDHAEVGRMPRLTVVRVDTAQQAGSWVKVLGATVYNTPEGYGHTDHNLGLVGWAHSRYMCDYGF